MASGIRQDSDDDLDELCEINITPFIDVMLVLLIIFMVAAPLSTVDVPVDLPAATARPEKRPEKPIFVSLKADRSMAIGETAIRRDMIGAELDAVTSAKRDTRLFLRADKSVPYGELMQVLNLLRGAGYLKVSLVGLEADPGGAAAAQPLPAGSPR